MSTPILILGDAPGEATGLARIARDLTARLHADRDALDIRVAQLGLGWTGTPEPWPVQRVADEENWGHADLPAMWDWHAQGDVGVLFTVWDPARCYGTVGVALPGGERWGYFPIDAHNTHGVISGPASEAVSRYERVLAYTRWGSRVLRGSTPGAVPYLPHGLDTEVFRPEVDPQALEQVLQMLHPVVRPERSTLIGCVAANQPRKDLGLLFGAVAKLREKDPKFRLWLHIDRPVFNAWSVPQLASDFGLNKALVVTTSLTDRQLAAMYALCAVTIAPGLGEGFGYPIVESLACGTPVVHGTYGGGAELVPRAEWKFPVSAERLESVYALVRPVYAAQDVANAVMRALEWRRREPEVVLAYCRGAVAHLSWDVLWPRWRSWFRKGLEAL